MSNGRNFVYLQFSPAEPKGVNLLPHPANRHISPVQAGSMRLKFISARGNQTCTNSIFDFSTRCSLFPILISSPILPLAPRLNSHHHHITSRLMMFSTDSRLDSLAAAAVVLRILSFFFTTTSFSALRTRPSI